MSYRPFFRIFWLGDRDDLAKRGVFRAEVLLYRTPTSSIFDSEAVEV